MLILSTIGEAPLNSLSGSLPVDGTVAKNVLSEISREVQSAGWHFNTHYKSTLTRDTNNKIPVGTNVVRVELDPNLVPKADYDLVQRDGFFLIWLKILTYLIEILKMSLRFFITF